MRRITLPDRPDWQAEADAAGFIFHSYDDGPYWRDDAAYVFTLSQIDDELEPMAEELHAMCLEVVGHAVHKRDVLRQLAIPDPYHDWIKQSWLDRQPHLYGRFDFRYDGQGPAKLYEYNADTPTAIFEAAVFQWQWLESRLQRGDLAPGTDQWTSVHEALIERFAEIADPDETLHFTCYDDGLEDRATTLYIEDCARQAGMTTHFLDIGAIGVDTAGQFADDHDYLIAQAFKLYPWEFMHREPFGQHLPGSLMRWIEPPWKAILSNKGLLPLLWEGWPDHDNLLPAFFGEDHPDLETDKIVKPLYSREGANIAVFGAGKAEPLVESPDEGYGAEGVVCQAYAPLPVYDEGYRPVLGIWMVGDEARGLGIREQQKPITDDDARFVPNIIEPYLAAV